MKQKYLEVIISYLKSDKRFTVFELYDFLKTETEIDGRKETVLSDLYKELIFDNRFYLYSDKKWGLREYMTAELLAKENKSTYNLDDYSSNINRTSVIDESFTEDELLGVKKRQSKTKMNITLCLNDNLSKLNNSNKKNVAQELGVTEEIDWDSLAEELNENN